MEQKTKDIGADNDSEAYPRLNESRAPRRTSDRPAAWDPLVSSNQQFKAMHERLREKPILGLASQQQQRYRHIKKKVDSIRSQQQQLFLDQLKQFPELSPEISNPENYAQIWESFQQSDANVNELVKKLGELTRSIDAVNKLSGEGGH